jgi:hypothetical protein
MALKASKYVIWRRYHSGGDWIMTAQKLLAFSDKDAQTRLRAKMRNMDLSNMSLVALKEGTKPS